MTDATAIPVLPCISLDETLAFYRSLGFEVTHQQTRPNVYAATRRGDLHLHFMGMPKLDPAKAYTTCLAIVPEVEALHRTFAAALRERYGRVPVSGIPRITRMKAGQSRFTVVDVAGNSIIFIRRDAPDDYDEGSAGPGSGSRLDAALRTAARLRDFRNDDTAAARVLDAALARSEAGTTGERARVLAARLEIAVAQGDDSREAEAGSELQALLPALAIEERAAIEEQLAAIDALRASTR